jgi:hypothetical protein
MESASIHPCRYFCILSKKVYTKNIRYAYAEKDADLACYTAAMWPAVYSEKTRLFCKCREDRIRGVVSVDLKKMHNNA